MVIAHHLDAEDRCLERVRAGLPHGGPMSPMTDWHNVYRLCGQADLDPGRCFFTNIYVGLRSGLNASGRFPARRDRDFTRWSRLFLDLQRS